MIENDHETKVLNEPHQNWESFKNQVKIISKKFGNFLSALRKNELIACQTLKNQKSYRRNIKRYRRKRKRNKKKLSEFRKFDSI